MSEETVTLKKPWLVAVWPGMGNVAITAGFYLMAKLGMHLLAEFRPLDLFEVEMVEVKAGLIRSGRLPRSRFFVWHNSAGRHDIVVFIGEAQPPTGKYAFCRRLIDFARGLGVERVFTFAAIATDMPPEQPSRVYGAATDDHILGELRQVEVEILAEGPIGGLNGVLLGVAAENQLPGGCLLGEMPHVFLQLPYPKASLAVLETFATLAGLEIDMTELREQAQAVEEKLGELFSALQQALQSQESTSGETITPPEAKQSELGPEDQQRIEQLFQQAQQDRSKAYELKRELDRLGAFAEYEDRFLDLFKKPE